MGLQVEPELTDALVEDVEGEPGALPLVSTALLELWQKRDGDTLTLAAYRDSGGVHGAVARLAESTYARFPDERKPLVRAIVLRLVGEGEGEAVVRRRAPLAELDLERNEDAADVLAMLTDSRLVTVDKGFVEVAHEALLREWPRLRRWIDEDAAGRRLRRHITQAASEWDATGRDQGELYRGARLAAALDWSTDHAYELNELEREFARYVGATHALATSSCTAALHLAMVATGIGPGDEVITTPMTFCATANSIVHTGATPVFADCRRDTMNIDPAAVEAAITPRTKAIIPVHFAGRPAEMEAIGALEHPHVVPPRQERADDVRADEARSPGHQDPHVVTSATTWKFANRVPPCPGERSRDEWESIVSAMPLRRATSGPTRGRRWKRRRTRLRLIDMIIATQAVVPDAGVTVTDLQGPFSRKSFSRPACVQRQ